MEIKKRQGNILTRDFSNNFCCLNGWILRARIWTKWRGNGAAPQHWCNGRGMSWLGLMTVGIRVRGQFILIVYMYLSILQLLNGKQQLRADRHVEIFSQSSHHLHTIYCIPRALFIVMFSQKNQQLPGIQVLKHLAIVSIPGIQFHF